MSTSFEALIDFKNVMTKLQSAQIHDASAFPIYPTISHDCALILLPYISMLQPFLVQDFPIASSVKAKLLEMTAFNDTPSW